MTNIKIDFYVTGMPQPMVRIPIDSITGIDFSPEGIALRKVIAERLKRRRFIRIFVRDCPEPHIFSMPSREADRLYDIINALVSARVEIRRIPDEIDKKLRDYEEKLNELKLSLIHI